MLGAFWGKRSAVGQAVGFSGHNNWNVCFHGPFERLSSFDRNDSKYFINTQFNKIQNCNFL